MARQVFYLNPAKDVEISFSGSKESALRKMREYTRRNHNVEQGFYDKRGVFHPIRASSDYSSKRGDGARRSKKKSKTKKRRR